MTTIQIAKAYRKKNGEIMFYINASNGVSFGVGTQVFTTKMTKGQWNAVNEMREAFEEHAVDFTGDIAAHTEEKQKLEFGYTLLITDMATVGGMSVGDDGAYLVRDSKIARIR